MAEQKHLGQDIKECGVPNSGIIDEKDNKRD